MASNLTSEDIDGQKVFLYSLFIISSVFALVGSLLIILVIFGNRELRRKHFFMLCGLAGADSIQAIGYLYAGVRRLLLVLDRRDSTQLVTPFDCMLEFYNSFFIFGQESSMLMIFVIALDRLLAVIAFNRYRTIGRRFAFVSIISVYAYSMMVTGFGWYASAYLIAQERIYSIICFSIYALPQAYYTYHGLAQLLPAVASIILYAIAYSRASVWPKSNNSQLEGDNSDNIQSVEKRRQAQITRNIAAIILFTFFSTTVPFGIVFLFNVFNLKMSPAFSVSAPYLWVLTCFCTGLNIFVYARKYPNFKKCLARMIGSVSGGHLGGGENRVGLVAISRQRTVE